jgi:MFS family permease
VGTLLSFATFAVGFVVRPLGGFVFGHFGDRIGRKRTLALTMALMGGGTALMGALPTAVQIGVLAPVLLLVLRVAQGFALGGEWAGAVLLAVEHSPRHRRGLFGSVPQIGLTLGLALGTGVFALLQALLSPRTFDTYGWRVAFLLSVVLVGVGIAVRLKASETPAFERVRAQGERSAMPIREVFRSPALSATVLGMLSRWGEGAAFNTWGVFAISYATAISRPPRRSASSPPCCCARRRRSTHPHQGRRLRRSVLRPVLRNTDQLHHRRRGRPLRRHQKPSDRQAGRQLL